VREELVLPNLPPPLLLFSPRSSSGGSDGAFQRSTFLCRASRLGRISLSLLFCSSGCICVSTFQRSEEHRSSLSGFSDVTRGERPKRRSPRPGRRCIRVPFFPPYPLPFFFLSVTREGKGLTRRVLVGFLFSEHGLGPRAGCRALFPRRIAGILSDFFTFSSSTFQEPSEQRSGASSWEDAGSLCLLVPFFSP